jgi:hypothetical protein
MWQSGIEQTYPGRHQEGRRSFRAAEVRAPPLAALISDLELLEPGSSLFFGIFSWQR